MMEKWVEARGLGRGEEGGVEDKRRTRGGGEDVLDWEVGGEGMEGLVAKEGALGDGKGRRRGRNR